MTPIFLNYESQKLFVSDPDLYNLIIWSGLIIFSIISIKKTDETGFLNRNQSEQLKGIAILMVLVSHLWVHVSQVRATFVMGSDAVSLFLLLSGFGLTRSATAKGIMLKKYINSRIRRVMIPYWLATILILFLDFIILGRKYAISDILLTISGINFSETTRNIDYVRWYITFILFWYIIFYLAIDHSRQTVRINFLILCAFIVYFGGYYVIPVGWSQIFAFPAGCIIGRYYESLQKFLSKKSKATLYGSAVLLTGGALIFKYLVLQSIDKELPGIVIKGLKEISSLSLGVGLIIGIYLLNKIGWYSRFLYFVGIISYELFLIHCAFLVKYNPVFKMNHLFTLPVTFFIYFSLVIIISMTFRNLATSVGA